MRDNKAVASQAAQMLSSGISLLRGDLVLVAVMIMIAVVSLAAGIQLGLSLHHYI